MFKSLNHLSKCCFIFMSSSASIKTSRINNAVCLHKQVPAGVRACDSTDLPYHGKLSPRWRDTKVLLRGWSFSCKPWHPAKTRLDNSTPSAHQAVIIPSHLFVKHLHTKSCVTVFLHLRVGKETAGEKKKCPGSGLGKNFFQCINTSLPQTAKLGECQVQEGMM